MAEDMKKISKLSDIIEKEIGGYWTLLYRENNKHNLPNTMNASRYNPPSTLNGFYLDKTNIIYDIIMYVIPNSNIYYYYKYITRPKYESLFEINKILYSLNNRINELEAINAIKNKENKNDETNFDSIIAGIFNLEKNIEEKNNTKYELVKDNFKNIIEEINKIKEKLN